MLDIAVGNLHNDAGQVYNLMNMMAGVWNDRVSHAVDETLLRTVVDQCNSFAGDLGNDISQLIIIRQELDNLAAQSFG